ncbi:MAG: bifunctional diguanylate cyclase/phosphohydrolase [Candidatus Dormibacteria bacterium]
MPPSIRERLMNIYVAAVAVAGIAMVALTMTSHLPDLWVVVVYSAAGIIAERIRVSVSHDSASMSPLLAIFLAAGVVGGPAAAALTGYAGGLGALLQRRRPPLIKIAFNTGLYALGAGAAGLTYQALGGALGQRPLRAVDLLAAAAAVVANFAVNWPLLVSVLRMATGRSYRQIWEESLRWTPLQIAILSAVGFTLGAAQNTFGWAGAAIYIAPTLAVREASRLLTGRMRRQLDEITEAHADADRANRALTEANQDLDTTNAALLRTLGSIIDARDVFLYGHSVQASQFSVRLARLMGLDDETIRVVELGGLLHDIGKVGVPDSILNKPGKLTEEEYDRVKEHCETGYALLAGLPNFLPVAEVVRSHHERWDGGGYPRGLAGTEIPIGARIVSAVESVEAMTSDRPYRRGLTTEEVLKELEEGSGSQWDPDVVQALTSVIRNDPQRGKMRNSALEVVLRNAGAAPAGRRIDEGAAAVFQTFEESAEAMFVLDDHLRVVSSNSAARTMLGRSETELTDVDWTRLCLAGEAVRGLPHSYFRQKRVVKLVRSDGTVLDCEVSGTPVKTSSAQYWMVLAHDVTERVQREQALLHRSRTDHLTGLASRAEFEERLARAVAAREMVSVILLDLDGLKVINDIHGHAAGDRALCRLADALRDLVPTPHLAARLGGDEFAILCVDGHEDAALALAVRVERSLDADPNMSPDRIAVSFGVAEWTGDESIQDLMRRADADLYSEKRRRNPTAGAVLVGQQVRWAG